MEKSNLKEVVNLLEENDYHVIMAEEVKTEMPESPTRFAKAIVLRIIPNNP